ncbi:MAG: tail fiber domain-containing protein, partial [Candidatus Neomarinimicrobiota bacterium]
MRLKPFLTAFCIIHFSVWSQTNKVNYSGTNLIEGIPITISYQGVLKNEQGFLAEGSYVMVFSIYSSESGDQSLWSEIHDSVGVNNGIINVLLGSLNALELPFDRPYSLGIKIGTNPELIPRIRFSSTPYSLSSRSVIGLSNIFPSEGSVGIGTDDPAALLHIAGNAIFDGNINVNGMLMSANDTLRLGSNLETAGNILSRGDLSAAGSLILKGGDFPADTSGYGNVFVLESDSKLYYRNAQGLIFDLTAGDTISPGEINTASNTGTGGAGLFKQKQKSILEFKNINAASSRISIYDDEENSEIDIDVIESSLELNKMKNILDIVKGGTGSKDVENARLNLGLSIGADIQAYHKVLESLTTADRSIGQFLIGDGTGWFSADGAEVWTSLELGTLAAQDSDKVVIKGGVLEGVSVGTNNPGAGTFLDLQSGTGGRDGLIRLYSEQGTKDYSIEFKPAHKMTQNTAYTLPENPGSAGQVLKTDGSGTLSWFTVEGTVPGGTAANDTIRWNGTGWVESTALVNDNTDLTASGDMTVEGGTLILGEGNSTQAGALVLHDGRAYGSYTTTLSANPALTAGFTLTLPPNDGAADQLLSTNGAGLLSWVNPLATGSTVNNTLRWDGSGWVESAILVNDGNVVTVTNGIIMGANSEMINLGSDNDAIVFTAGGAEKMRIHSNGNIGIGTSNPEELLHIKMEDAISNNVTNLIRLEHSTTGTPSVGLGTGLSFYIEDESGIHNQGTLEVIMDVVDDGNEESSMVFNLRKAGVLSEIMRIDGTNGYVGIGSSSPTNKLSVIGNSNNDPIVSFNNIGTGIDADVLRLSIGASTQASTNSFISFYNSGGIAGNIVGSSIGVTYSTTSDRRLKENIKDTDYNLNDLKKIRVRDFEWVGLGNPSTGFIAQELFEIFPDA